MNITTDYRPSQTVLDRLRNVDFVAVIGPTAVGKTTLITELLRTHPAVQLIVTDTSRPPRPGERDDVNYRFMDREAMLAAIRDREYVNLAPSITGDLYASHPDKYLHSGVGIMATLSDTVPYFQSLPFRSFTPVFIVPPDWSAWQTRLAAHRFTPEQRPAGYWRRKNRYAMRWPRKMSCALLTTG